ncbi:GLUG motif-containing protein [Methanolobus halotolerans]|nr:GLUG motif-containing protein [Methanolobus halotolerans]
MIAPASAFSGGGSGTEADPYQISNVAELQNMSLDLSANYTLINDIDASDTVNWNTGDGFDPIGDSSNKFTGTFDGNEFIISNLTINRSGERYVGLFGYTAGSFITNVSLEKTNVTGGDYHVGGLVGYNSGGSINKSYSMGNVTGTNYVGGLVGTNRDGTINTSYSTGNVTGTDNVGGLVGENWDASINQGYSTCNVDGDSDVGGLVGWNEGSGVVTQSYSTGSVTGSSDVGGLVGTNYGGSINTSYSTGTVAGNDDVGGLVGENNNYIYQSYSTGTVNGSTDVGGLVGKNNDGSVNQSYSTGTVSGSNYVGGLVGNNSDGSVVDQSYWDIDTSGQASSDEGDGRTTENMTHPYNSHTTYLSWDFTDVWGIHGGINDGYPALLSLTNFPPNVSITKPEASSYISDIFFVNASVTDPNGDSYISSVYLNNTTGNIASYTDLPQDNYSVPFDSTFLVDGIYNITWESYENETADGLSGFQTINIHIDNTNPTLSVNDDTDEGNLSQDFVICNISFSDENLNSSTIAVYNASGLVGSNVSSISPHSVVFEDLEEGKYQLNATVSDKAGNVVEMTTREIVLDTTSPSINQIIAPSEANTGDNITIKLNATDNIGVETYNITVDGEEYRMEENSGNYTHNISIPASDSGTLVSSITYNCTFVDAAGNINSTDDVVIDVSILPVADFSASLTRGNTPLSVEFTDHSSGLVQTWNWDFGDGSTSTDQNPSHVFGSGNFTVYLTVENSNGTSSKELNVRAVDEPAYTVSPNEGALLSKYGDDMNFSINSTLYSSYEWFIDGTPLNGSGVTLYNNNTDDSVHLSYCNVNTSQYIAQEDFFMDVYNISAHVSNESIDRTDVFTWEWTVTNSSTEDADDIDQIINTTPEVNTSGNESYVRFNTSNQISEKTGIECSIDFVSFNTSNETDGIQIKIEVLNTSALNESDIDFSKNSVYQYLDISFNNESLVNDGSKNRSIEFKVLNNVGGGSLIIDTVYLKHKGTSGWQSYEPELIRNDFAYSYFIVRDIPGFSPFAVTADYEYDSGTRSDDGIPAYLKLQMLQNRSQSTKEDMDDKTVVTLGSESDEDIVQEDTTSDSSEQTIGDVPISDEGDNGQVLFIGIGVLVLFAILVLAFRKKEN